MDFVLDSRKALKIIGLDKNYEKVIKPYLTGDDITSELNFTTANINTPDIVTIAGQ